MGSGFYRRDSMTLQVVAPKLQAAMSAADPAAAAAPLDATLYIGHRR